MQVFPVSLHKVLNEPDATGTMSWH